jgi:hypothetical protein
MIDISKNISMNEACRSIASVRRGIKNEPDVTVIRSMQYLAQTLFEPLRAHFNVPILILSFFRCFLLNKAVKGALNSQHVTGEAMDIKGTNGVTIQQIFDYIRTSGLPYDQLILEPTWVHVSLKKGNNRYQALVATLIDGVMKYKPYQT